MRTFFRQIIAVDRGIPHQPDAPAKEIVGDVRGRYSLYRLAILSFACASGWCIGFALAEEPKDVEKRAPTVLPGMQPGGKILLPNQWSLRPAG